MINKFYHSPYSKLALTINLSGPVPPFRDIPGYKKVFRRFAFTLAEVLITLTIIGIIAAMTIPTLVSKYQNHTYVVGLKKAYSVLQNALERLPIDEDCSAGDYSCVFSTNSTGIRNYYEIFKKQFRVVKSCEPGHLNECVDSTRYKFLNKSPMTYSHITLNDTSTAGAIILEDGMALMLPNGTWSTITVDINGNKGPNVQGRDLFHFVLDTNKGQLLPYGGDHEKNYNQYWRDNTDCTPRGQGKYCAGRVLEEDKMDY